MEEVKEDMREILLNVYFVRKVYKTKFQNEKHIEMVHTGLISVFVVNEFLLVVFVIELLEHDGILTGLHSS